MENFGKFCFSVILLVLTLFISGFVFIKLYEWFIMSLFQLPKITLAQALGIMLFIGYLNRKATKLQEKSSFKEYGENFLNFILIATITLVFGYILLQFI